MSQPTRILIYGDLKLNLVDGSAIWLESLAELLGGTPDLSCDLLLKVDTDRLAPLRQAGVRPLCPSEVMPEARRAAAGGGTMLAPAVTAERLPDLVARLDTQEGPYDLLLVRGREACLALAEALASAGRLVPYLTDIPQRMLRPGDPDYRMIERIVGASARILCQTEAFRTFLEGLFPHARGRCALLPPMVPDAFYAAEGGTSFPQPTLIYAGKFAPQWGTDALFEITGRLRERHPDFRTLVFGDKVHEDPDDVGFHPRTLQRLRETPGLEWRQAVERGAMPAALGEATIGYALRHPAMDDSLELSTKVLEYGAAGLPVLLNRNPRHVELLGADYPLFASDTESACAVLEPALADPALLAEAANRTRVAAAPYRMSALRERVGPALQRAAPVSRATQGKRPRLLVASHDLKFLGPLTAEVFRPDAYDVRYDHWRSLRDHDETASRRLLAEADMVFCEWCAGNAVWHSRHVQPHQRLYIRFHRVEINTELPEQVQIDRVTRVVFVGEHLREQAIAAYGWPREKTAVIPNPVDTADFDRSKSPWSPYHLGMAGILPELKRLDLAISLLQRLLEADPRFKLYVRGKLPWELEWLWQREANRGFYLEQFRRLAEDPRLADAVIFEPFDTDMPRWLRKVGYILSLSDVESFHLACAEGMASGALPLIAEREGANTVFPPRWVFPDLDAMAETVLGLRNAPERARLAEEARAFVRERYDLAPVMDAWRRLLAREAVAPAGSPAASAAVEGGGR